MRCWLLRLVGVLNRAYPTHLAYGINREKPDGLKLPDRVATPEHGLSSEGEVLEEVERHGKRDSTGPIGVSESFVQYAMVWVR